MRICTILLIVITLLIAPHTVVHAIPAEDADQGQSNAIYLPVVKRGFTVSEARFAASTSCNADEGFGDLMPSPANLGHSNKQVAVVIVVDGARGKPWKLDWYTSGSADPAVSKSGKLWTTPLSIPRQVVAVAIIYRAIPTVLSFMLMAHTMSQVWQK